jgi:hypothetical protein
LHELKDDYTVGHGHRVVEAQYRICFCDAVFCIPDKIPASHRSFISTCNQVGFQLPVAPVHGRGASFAVLQGQCAVKGSSTV